MHRVFETGCGISRREQEARDPGPPRADGCSESSCDLEASTPGFDCQLRKLGQR